MKALVSLAQFLSTARFLMIAQIALQKILKYKQRNFL